MKVSVVGLGKLGLPMAAAFAARGMRVTGVDINENTIKALNEGVCPIAETNLDEYLALCRDNIKFTTEYKAVADTDITFIIVPTPSENGIFTNRFILEAIRGILPYQKNVISITSTVMPNSMGNVIAPFIKELSGKVAGKDIGLCYNPEFIALGSVIENILHPDSILIGESDKQTGDTLERFYGEVCGKVPICRMSWENAECAKLMLNVAVTAKISLANTFAYVCENVKGGNVDDITHFIGLDSRIGAKYLKGGAAFGGTCFPRDNVAFAKFCEGLNIKGSEMSQSIIKTNTIQNLRLNNMVLTMLANIHQPKVVVVGLAYKPGTAVTEESAGIKLVRNLKASGINVVGYDEQPVNEEGAITDGNLTGALMGADLAVITLPNYKLSPVLFKQKMRTPQVLDCWRTLKKADCEFYGVNYRAIGLG